jgi:hypothetical protein
MNRTWNPALRQWVKGGTQRAGDSAGDGDNWALLLSYWTWYPDRMLAVLLGEDADYTLTLVQALIQRILARYQEVFITGSRGTTKTYNAMLSKLADCLRWPGEKIRYFGPALNQTAEIAQKTYAQISKNYPVLAAHFDNPQKGKDSFELVTGTGSEFTITTMRGDNCHQVLCEEVGQEEQPLFDHRNYRSIVLPSVRLRHQADRRPDPSHLDFKKQYITSACRQQNEAYRYRCDILKAMRAGKSAFVLDIPWQVAVLSGIRDMAWAEDLRRKLTAEEWMREMESRYTGVSENPVIRDEVLTEAKKIEVMETHHCQNPYVFYIIGYDVSYEEGVKHAKCAVTALKCSAQRRADKQDTYLKQLVYVNDMDPVEASAQARYLKDLWRQYSLEASEYPCYIAIDNRQYGKSVTEQLMKDMGDGQPICCMDHRYVDLELPDALPIIYPVAASNAARETGKGDSDWEMMKYAEVQFERGNVHILTTNVGSGVDAYKRFHRIKDGDDDALFSIPYLKCRELCGQISNLKRKESGMGWREARISKVIQRDMWSALKYALRLAQILERKNLAVNARTPSDWVPAFQAAAEGTVRSPAQAGLRPRVLGRTGRLL